MNATEDAFEFGYDSEGDGPPVNRTTGEEEELEEEEPLGEAPLVNNDAAVANDTDDEEEVIELEPPPNAPVFISENDLAALKVSQIQEELRIRGVTYNSQHHNMDTLQFLRLNIG